MIPGAARCSGASLQTSPCRLALILCALICAVAGALMTIDGLRIKTKASLAQILLERAWTKTINEGTDARPWPWADISPVMVIEAPRLNQKEIVLKGTNGEAMAFGPGWMPNTPAPGNAGLSILAGHRDTHFSFLRGIKIGDEILVQRADGLKLRFAIRETRIVNAYQSGLSTEGDQPEIALVTCWPFDARERGDDRFVAIASLVK